MSDSRSHFVAAQFLHMLKETCALHCLLALSVLGPLPVSQRAVMDLTGFDDEAVHKGLNKLLILGLAVCAGEDYRSGWQLGPAANTVPLPLHLLGATAPGPIPVLPESDSLKEEEKDREKEESIIHNDLLDSSDDLTTSAAPNRAAPTAAPHSVAVVVSPAKSRQRASPLRPRTPAPQAPLPKGPLPDAQALRRAFYLVFEASDIYLQFRRPLADGLLAEDGPAWLHQALGWLCHARRHLPHVQAGAVVYISLRDRLPCDSAYLPPPNLPFAAALAWALRGGEPEEIDQPAGPESDGAETLADSAAAAACETPEDRLWQALLERLSGELPRATLDGQLRPARLAAFDDHCCLIAAPTPQSRDWLNARLRTVLAQALGELTHKTMTVEIIVE